MKSRSRLELTGTDASFPPLRGTDDGLLIFRTRSQVYLPTKSQLATLHLISKVLIGL